MKIIHQIHTATCSSSSAVQLDSSRSSNLRLPTSRSSLLVIVRHNLGQRPSESGCTIQSTLFVFGQFTSGSIDGFSRPITPYRNRGRSGGREDIVGCQLRFKTSRPAVTLKVKLTTQKNKEEVLPSFESKEDEGDEPKGKFHVSKEV